jgi:hypothetical protein
MPKKNKFTIDESILPVATVGPLNEQPLLQGTAPRGFVYYQDGIFRGYVRKSDGMGLRDLHKDGMCPSDCPYCKGDNKQAEQTADHAGMKAQATAIHWKSGRTKVNEAFQTPLDSAIEKIKKVSAEVYSNLDVLKLYDVAALAQDIKVAKAVKDVVVNLELRNGKLIFLTIPEAEALKKYKDSQFKAVSKYVLSRGR